MPAKRSLWNGFNRCAARASIRKLRNITQPPLLRPSKVASRLLLSWAHSTLPCKGGEYTLSRRLLVSNGFRNSGYAETHGVAILRNHPLTRVVTADSPREEHYNH